MTVDFGIFRLLSLGDLVWEDTNNNGTLDGGESGIDGVTVELYTDTNGNGTYDPGTDTFEDTTTTMGGGLYRFDNLLPGEYLVVLPASNFADNAVLDGYTSSTGGGSEPGPDVDSDADNDDDNGSVAGTLGSGGFIATNAITLAPNSEPTDDGDTDPYTNLSVDMGVFLLAGIGDRVWYDTNLDGIQDLGENGVDGVTVTLYNSSGTAVLTTTTTAGGFYSFTDLQPGEYSVGFSDLPAGHVFTDSDQGGDDADSDADPTTGRTISTTLDPGEYDPTWDAGIYQLAGLGNYVWEDLNRDGVQDPGEPPIPGVTVHLYDPADPTTPISTTTTGTAGDYFFGDLIPGDYLVEFVPPTGYELTLDGQGGDGAFDSDADPTTGRTATVTLAPGEVNPNLDAGLFRRASLGDYVWYDINIDGVQDSTESGIDGVTVRLLDNSGTAILTTTTDATGFYEFTNLLPGTPYQVEFLPPNGYRISPQDQGSDDTIDSDADRSTGRTATITLGSGEHNPTLDAGMYELASIGDYVWLDADGDGVQDLSETGVVSVIVHLYDGNGGLVTTTTTDSTGFYEFPDLEPDDYAVTVVPPAGYQISPNDQGNDDRADSNADPTTGAMPTTTLEPGENDLTWDAGLYTPVSLGNHVWEDTNNNGVVDAGETGVPGITVELYRDTNGDGQAQASELVTTTTTDGSGHYQFSDLAPGDYMVALPASMFAPTGPLADYTSSTGQWGMAEGPYEGSATPDPNNDRNNDDNGTTAADGRVVSAPVTLVVGTEPTNDDDTDASSNLSVDFGVFLPASVGSTVWLDEDRDGQKDPSEPGVPDVTIILYDADGNEVARTTTDADGSYQFVNLPPGTYEIAFEPPQDYSFTDANTGDDGRDSDADPLTGRTGPITLEPGENDPNWWAGLVALDPAAIVLEQFTATWQQDTVVVAWETSAELDSWGFHLYRSADRTWDNATQVTEQLILAQGRGQGGANYQWTDADVTPGTTYTYWLVETELDGSTHRYGPAQTTVTPKTADYQIFLPIVGR
ncbi:MAG: SdrD B-like domain-containing protein [Chloroflexota bacterium]